MKLEPKVLGLIQKRSRFIAKYLLENANEANALGLTANFIEHNLIRLLEENLPKENQVINVVDLTHILTGNEPIKVFQKKRSEMS